MIVVTGAAGRLGGAVVAELLKRMPPDGLGVSTTRPADLADLAARGVRVRLGSFDDEQTLRHAFEGAERVLIVSAPRHGAAAVVAHRIAIDAARDAGVGRLFYTSHVGADALSPFPPAVTHATTEVMLRDSGIAFTSLRNGFYPDVPLRLAREAIKSGQLRAPRDAPVSWTFHRDLAPAIASILTDHRIEDSAINLTSQQTVDMSDLARLISVATGRQIQHVQVDDDDYREELRGAGTPDIGITMMLGMFQASRQRHLGICDPTLESRLARPATSIQDALVDRP